MSVGRRDDAGGPVPYVGADYPAAVAALVQRAGELGHTRIGYLGTGGPAESHADRLRGFQPGGDRLHLPLSGPLSGQLSGWLDAIGRERLTAVFLEEHADAVALVVAARARGWSVPGDLSVVALGEPVGTGPLDEEITRLRIPRREMGWQAVDQLTAAIESGGAGNAGVDAAVQRLLPCTIHAGATLVSRR
ncbi:LacI family DNA-binding transcriptional regulator [Dactylosporangium cerinum]